MKSTEDLLESAFQRDSNYAYFDSWSDDLPQNISFAISRNPIDLILHQQRIEYCVRKHDQPSLFAALVDLFIVLGDKGIPYKKRQLKQNQSYLSNDQKHLLKLAINTGLSADLPIKGLHQSIFNHGLEGELLTSDLINNLMQETS